MQFANFLSDIVRFWSKRTTFGMAFERIQFCHQSGKPTAIGFRGVLAIEPFEYRLDICFRSVG